MLGDGNGDGQPDFRGLPEGRARRFSAHTSYAETWESLHCDGVFDLHTEFDSNGEVERLQVDLDRDGVYDEEIQGQSAKRRISILLRSSHCMGYYQDIEEISGGFSP